MGEMLFRFSSLVLKNEATGRTIREVGARLIDPIRGFNRLVRGEMKQISRRRWIGDRAGSRPPWTWATGASILALIRLCRA